MFLIFRCPTTTSRISGLTIETLSRTITKLENSRLIERASGRIWFYENPHL